jgi:hypothetical protein
LQRLLSVSSNPGGQVLQRVILTFSVLDIEDMTSATIAPNTSRRKAARFIS